MVKKPKKSTLGRRRVEFRLDKPGANAVSLAGDFNCWDLESHRMHRNGKGIWSKAVMGDPGRYEYRFYADRQWCNDPVNPAKCANCFGTLNDIVNISSKHEAQDR